MSRWAALNALFGLFAASVVLTNAVSANLIQVGPFLLVAGTLLYPVTFLLTDVIGEVYGPKVASRAVWVGFAAQVLAVGFVQLTTLFPSVDAAMGEAFREVFNPMWRIAAGSMIAYLISQHIDVRIFERLKQATARKHLWFRNNLSTLISQWVDSLIFGLVAFYGTMPWADLKDLIVSVYVAKALLAILDTPVCYLAVGYVKSLPTKEKR